MATQTRIGSAPLHDFGADLLAPGRRSAGRVETRWFDLDIEAPDGPTLAQLLPHQDLDAVVNAAIVPPVRDAQLLMPRRFVEALLMARETLAGQAQSRRGDGTARSEALGKAASVLDDHEAMYALLRANRLALFQG